MTVQTPPAVVPALGWRFPAVREAMVGPGIPVLAYHCPGQFVASVSLVLDVSLDVEPREREGVAGLAARLLLRGAGGLAADAFGDELAACGADLEAVAQPDGFTVQLAVPVSHLGRGLELMALAVREPTYDGSEFAQEQRLRLQEIEHAKAYPGVVTVDLLNAALFGSARAARPAGGGPDTVSAITRDDVVAYAERHLLPGRATLVVAGDLGDVPVMELAQRAFGAWPVGAAPAGTDAVSPAPETSRAPRVLLVDWPDASQATMRLAGPGITRGDPSWPALFVANYVVGGSFSSRLNTELRERQGLTYGVGSTLDSGRHLGLVGVGAGVQGDSAGRAVAETLRIFAAAGDSLDDEEVGTAVGAVTDSAPLGFERAASVVARVEMLLAQRLPPDHVDANLARLRAVTTADANRAWAHVVHPDEFTVVVAAPAAEAVDSLAAVGHAEVEVIPRP